jgi:hypothetical protein
LSEGRLRFVASGVTLNEMTRLSSDGDVLTFLSSRTPTADRVASQCPELTGATGGIEPCQELYRYDDRDGSIECLSCRRGGITTKSVALSSFGKPFQVAADGSTAAFVTAERLLPRDVNKSADLYEWRGGALRLITDGVTHYPTGLAGPTPVAVDATGSNIVFSVASPGLTGYEHDGVANLYDARIGGGFERPSPPEHCEGESCQGPLAAAPASSASASSKFIGRGNHAHTQGCSPAARRAKALRRRARALRRGSRHGDADAPTRRLAKRASRLTRRAHRLAKRARRCRHVRRRTAK